MPTSVSNHIGEPFKKGSISTKIDPIDNSQVAVKQPWKRSLAWRDPDFVYDGEQHPHYSRRNAILSEHPQIRKLFKRDPMMLWVILFCAANQILLTALFGMSKGTLGWIILIPSALIIGASICVLQAVLIHECSHSLVSKSPMINKALLLLCNVGTIIPIAMGFRRYHHEHHVHQGSEEKDPDLPLPWELKLIKGQFLHKLLWLTIYPIMYAVRAMVRSKSVTLLESINMVFTIACDILCCYFFGTRGFVYLLISFVFGYTFHPAAAHFIQEHYTYADGQETYNYYGWANTLYVNIGFHNEHHDFKNVPGRLLPLITKVAPKYYLPLLAHKSWRNVIWSFMTDSNLGPQSRCARLK